jgi:hypothetical protein
MRADTVFDAFESRVSTLSVGDASDLSGFGLSVFAPPVVGELSGALLGDIADELSRLETRLRGVDLLVISCSRSVPVQPCSLFTACHDMSLVAIFRQPLRKLG